MAGSIKSGDINLSRDKAVRQKNPRGGWIADVLRQRGYADAAVCVIIVTVLLIAPVAVLMPLMQSAATSLVLLALLPLLLFVIGAVVPTAFQLVTPGRHSRARSSPSRSSS